MRLLLAEDDRMIGDSVHQGLCQDGFVVDWVRDGLEAELALETIEYDGLLLDLGLPRKDGIAILKALRARGDTVPVLILTARDAVANRIEGLDQGADDYIVKPFDLDELTARIRAVLRRRSGRAQAIIQYGALMLDPSTHQAIFNSKPVALSRYEFALLEVLASRPGLVFSRDQLEQRLYGWGQETESNTVEVYIHKLRKKFGVGIIRNIHGVGYTMTKPA